MYSHYGMSEFCVHIRNVFIREEYSHYGMSTYKKRIHITVSDIYKKRIHITEWVSEETYFVYIYKKRIHITEWVTFVYI